jgi:GcrA cell cycle regulator
MPPNLEYWNEDRIAQLKECWARGLSSGQIGKEWGVSRNKICGKVARLGLEPRAPRMNDAQKQQRKLDRMNKINEKKRLRRAEHGSSKPPTPIVAIAPFMGSLEIPFADLRPFSNSHSNECRHIAGEPPGPDYLACGNPTPNGTAYCVHHAGALYYRGLSLSDIERERRALNQKKRFATQAIKLGDTSYYTESSA